MRFRGKENHMPRKVGTLVRTPVPGTFRAEACDSKLWFWELIIAAIES